jgi:hypothetical protein
MDNYAAIQHSINVLTFLHREENPMPSILTGYSDDEYQMIREAAARQGVSMRKYVQRAASQAAKETLAEPRPGLPVALGDTRDAQDGPEAH